MITKMELIILSCVYHTYHKVKDEDVEKARMLIQRIEDQRREDRPVPGDVIICKGPKKTYNNGHLEKDPYEFSSICTVPSKPFVSGSFQLFSTKEPSERLYYTTSGGYWLGELDYNMFTYKERRRKLFKAWGHCGPCGDGAFTFPAVVNVWELFLEYIY